MSRFFWAWDGERQLEDASMTRARAAAMLRAWRADPDIRITLTARRTYRGETEGAGRVGWTMVIR
tara:strand:+ start:426 stop:620 length:195 start_codon:yes stop_codon:yes gene_type:complete